MADALVDNRQVNRQDVSTEQEVLSRMLRGNLKRRALVGALVSVVVLSLIVAVLVAIPRDSDGDGLLNVVEISGWRTADGAVYITDPYKADTDSDGLTDAEEAGESVSSLSDSPIYKGISNPTMADSDNDGLDDKTELRGWRAVGGITYRTEPMKPDTDDDGLTDGEEANALTPGARGPRYEAISSPVMSDSDLDGIGDFEEYDLGTDLWQPDTDSDGLSDYDEVELHNTDPRIQDSDGDGYDDAYELEHVDEGFAPLEPHVIPNPNQWAEDFYVGAVKGVWEERDTIAWLAGYLTQGGTVFIPVIGEVVGAAGDIRDLLAQTLRGEYGDAAWSAIGLTPVLGLAALTPRIIKFVKRTPNLRVQVDSLIDKLGVDSGWKLELRKAVWGSSWEQLAARGFPDSQMMKLSPSQRANLIEEIQARPSSLGSPTEVIAGASRTETGRNAELAHLAKLKASKVSNIEVQKSISVPRSCSSVCGPRPTRKLDVCSGKAPKLSCAEVKAGYTPFSTHIKEEIARDVELLKNSDIKNIEYHFYWSAGSNSIGASPKVLEMLRQHNIPYKIHPPT